MFIRKSGSRIHTTFCLVDEKMEIFMTRMQFPCLVHQSGIVVGHVPRTTSAVCSMFLR